MATIAVPVLSARYRRNDRDAGSEYPNETTPRHGARTRRCTRRMTQRNVTILHDEMANDERIVLSVRTWPWRRLPFCPWGGSSGQTAPSPCGFVGISRSDGVARRLVAEIQFAAFRPDRRSDAVPGTVAGFTEPHHFLQPRTSGSVAAAGRRICPAVPRAQEDHCVVTGEVPRTDTARPSAARSVRAARILQPVVSYGYLDYR